MAQTARKTTAARAAKPVATAVAPVTRTFDAARPMAFMRPEPDFEAGIYTAMPYETEVARCELRTSPRRSAWSGRAILALRERVAELEAEVMDLTDDLTEAYRDLENVMQRPSYNATLRQIVYIAAIGNGALIRDVYESLETVTHDLLTRRETDDKGKVKVMLKVQGDKDDTNLVLVDAEVQTVVPPSKSGGRCTVATDGTLILTRDVIDQLPLLDAGDAKTTADKAA